VTIYERLLKVKEQKGAGFLVLVDPDKLSEEKILQLSDLGTEGGVDALLIGGSLLLSLDFDNLVARVKQEIQIPLIIFPGSTKQVSGHADAILFLSLISGRNPTYLIGEQVLAAPLIKETGIEPIPTGYMLIESGRSTTVQFMSDTQPIPRDKPEITMAHALAAQYLGMKLVYLEAGSGAQHPVPEEMIQAVRDYISIPIVVGGGIRSPEVAYKKVKAGASFIVIGNVLEEKGDLRLVQEFSEAIHFRERVLKAASS